MARKNCRTHEKKVITYFIYLKRIRPSLVIGCAELTNYNL